jgi:Cdc6-like AAA superfamily ATPase
MSAMNEATIIEQKTKVLDWFTPVNYGLQQSDFIKRRQEGTGNWLLESGEFQHWLHRSKQALFCQGMPGSGKTIMASIVINHLDTKFKADADIGIAYLYCNFRQQYQRSDLLASLLKQLAWRRSIIPESMQKLFEHHRNRQTRPSLEEIFSELQSIVASYQRVFVIVDALDECQVSDGGRTKFLTEILSFQAKTGINLFATSRVDPEIAKLFERSISLEIRARNEDVQRYLDGQMSQLPSFVQSSSDLQDEIKTTISEAVNGMYVYPPTTQL